MNVSLSIVLLCLTTWWRSRFSNDRLKRVLCGSNSELFLRAVTVILSRYNYVCVAALIDNKWAITSVHCTEARWYRSDALLERIDICNGPSNLYKNCNTSNYIIDIYGGKEDGIIIIKVSPLFIYNKL